MSNCKKIVITGASGFLGSHLVERLKDDEKYIVYALSSRPDELKEKIGGTSVEYLHKDAFKESGKILEAGIVVNCAYPRNSTGIVIADGLKYIQGVFEAAVENRAAAIINISSQSVYSQQRTEAATEDTPLCLESPYAVGKHAIELMLESICKGSSTKFTSLRMASLIGPGFDQRIVNRFALKLLNHEPVTVLRQKKQMGYLDVEDAVSAILAVSNYSDGYWKKIYNVGNGMGYTVEAIYEAVSEALKNKVEITDPIIEEGTDSSCTAVSYETLHADTGYTPAIDIKNSIERIIAQM